MLIKTRKELSRVLGVSTRTISKWLKVSPPMPVLGKDPNKKGGYVFNLEDIKLWLKATGRHIDNI